MICHWNEYEKGNAKENIWNTRKNKYNNWIMYNISYIVLSCYQIKEDKNEI